MFRFPLGQIYLTFAIQYFSIGFIAFVKPMKRSAQDKIEIFNEVTILALLTIQMQFSDFNFSGKIEAGWIYCFVILFNTLVNNIFVLWFGPLKFIIRKFFEWVNRKNTKI